MTVEIKFKHEELDKWIKDVKKAPFKGYKARKEIKEIFHNRGKEMVEEAQRIVPVRTGYLKSTINYSAVSRVGKISLMFRAEAYYAGYVEYGTKHMKARHFMTRSWNKVQPEVVKDLGNLMTKWAKER